MSNTITASIEFFFRGQKIAASLELDLDQYMQTTGKIPDLFPLLARAGSLDIYSYEYEMMQAEEILFSNAGGMSADFVDAGKFDYRAFELAWEKHRLQEMLEDIARRHLSVDDLKQQSDLKNALQEAYLLGKNTEN